MSFSLNRIVDTDLLVAVGEDITHRRELQTELHRQAHHDSLTGLPNRLHLIEALDASIAATADGDRLGLCFLDLDGFKAVNDRLGHRIGDLLLIDVARRLAACAAANGHFLARLGGDEFVAVIAAPTDPHRVDAAAKDFVAALDAPFRIDEHDLSVSASIGALVAPVDGMPAEALIGRADAGLYRAKAHGRGSVTLHVEK